MQRGNAAALIICFRADGACRHFDFDQLVTMACKAEMLLLSSSISELMGHVNMLHLQQACMLLTTRRSSLSQMGLLFGCTGRSKKEAKKMNSLPQIQVKYAIVIVYPPVNVV